MPGSPEIEKTTSEGAGAHSLPAEGSAANGIETRAPRVVHRDGMAYVEGCSVPVWQLERAHRAGSSAAALLGAFPMLTPEGLDLAFAYSQTHREEVDTLIRELGPTDVPPEDEEDDEDEVQADLDEIFETYGEVFRRLAQ